MAGNYQGSLYGLLHVDQVQTGDTGADQIEAGDAGDGG